MAQTASQAPLESTLPSWRAWVLATRPKTLTAAIVPVAVASSLAYADSGRWQWVLALCALISSLWIQIGTNFINDAIDFKRGADGEGRLGPLRATQQGFLTHRQVFGGGVACFALAFLFGLPLIIVGQEVLIAILALSILCGYLYTGGPWPLAYVGLGDFFVLLFFGFVSSAAIYYVQVQGLSCGIVLAGAQIGLLATAIIAVNNSRDREQDKKVHKKTLAVRFGLSFARMEVAICLLLPFVLGVGWIALGCFWAFLLPMLLLPRAVRLVRDLFNTAPGAVYNAFLGQAALLHLLFGAILSAAFLL